MFYFLKEIQMKKSYWVLLGVIVFFGFLFFKSVSSKGISKTEREEKIKAQTKIEAPKPKTFPRRVNMSYFESDLNKIFGNLKFASRAYTQPPYNFENGFYQNIDGNVRSASATNPNNILTWGSSQNLPPVVFVNGYEIESACNLFTVEVIDQPLSSGGRLKGNFEFCEYARRFAYTKDFTEGSNYKIRLFLKPERVIGKVSGWVIGVAK